MHIAYNIHHLVPWRSNNITCTKFLKVVINILHKKQTLLNKHLLTLSEIASPARYIILRATSTSTKLFTWRFERQAERKPWNVSSINPASLENNFFCQHSKCSVAGLTKIAILSIITFSSFRKSRNSTSSSPYIIMNKVIILTKVSCTCQSTLEEIVALVQTLK